MKVKDLKKMLESLPDDENIGISSCGHYWIPQNKNSHGDLRLIKVKMNFADPAYNYDLNMLTDGIPICKNGYGMEKV